MSRQAVIVHRMRAENGLAVLAPNHPHAPRCAVEGATDRADAGRTDVEPPVRLDWLHLTFLGLFTHAIIRVGQRDLEFKRIQKDLTCQMMILPSAPTKRY